MFEVEYEWIGHAMELAELAEATGDVPVGALVVWEGQSIGCGYNTREAEDDPAGHAEITALRRAAAAMCAGQKGRAWGMGRVSTMGLMSGVAL